MPFYYKLKIKKNDSAAVKTKKRRVVEKLGLLREALNEHIKKSRNNPTNAKTVKIATWNIREFGGNKYKGRTFDEIENLWAHENLQQQTYHGQQIQQEVDLISEIETVVKKGVALTNAVQDKTLSNKQRVEEIRDNRAFEKQKRREREGFELSDHAKESQNNAKVETNQPLKSLDKGTTSKHDTSSRPTKNSETSSSNSVKRKNLSLIARKRKEQKNKKQ